jgi:hypothetical protein
MSQTSNLELEINWYGMRDDDPTFYMRIPPDRDYTRDPVLLSKSEFGGVRPALPPCKRVDRSITDAVMRACTKRRFKCDSLRSEAGNGHKSEYQTSAFVVRESLGDQEEGNCRLPHRKGASLHLSVDEIVAVGSLRVPQPSTGNHKEARIRLKHKYMISDTFGSKSLPALGRGTSPGNRSLESTT